MKKRWCSILTALLLLLPLAAMPASADAGPKPSVVVELTGLEGRTCWGTLLSQQEGTGPYGRFSEGETVEGPEKDRALRAMRPLDQMDPEGFYLLDFAEDCSDGELSWTYYPPHTYQIALWFPEEDALAVSAVYHRYAFDSYYRLDLSGLELTPGGIVELEAAQIPRSLADCDIAVINGNYAIESGLKVADALATESSDSLAATTYGNVVAVREGDENREDIKALIEALTSPEVKAFMENKYEGAVVPMF